MSLLIGLTGSAGSGKNTFADLLCERHDFTQMAFADDLRQSMLDLDPLIPLTTRTEPPYEAACLRLSDLIARDGWDAAKRTFPEVRRLLQTFGTEVVRERWPGAWVNILAGKLEINLGDVAVTDCRFDDEAVMIREKGGFIVRLVRPNNPDSIATGHASEAGVSPELIDFMIPNSGTIEHLGTNVDYVVNELLLRES